MLASWPFVWHEAVMIGNAVGLQSDITIHGSLVGSFEERLSSYQRTSSEEDLNRAALAAVPMGMGHLTRLVAKIHHSLHADEFVDVLFLAAREAIKRFEPERGIKFSTFFNAIIDGRVRDEIRSSDPLPRLDRILEKKIALFSQATFAATGSAPDESAVIGEIGITPRQLREHQRRVAAAHPNSFDVPLSEDPDAGPMISELRDSRLSPVEKSAEAAEFWQLIERSLTKDQFRFLEMYVREERTLNEIGACFGFTESRAAQISREIAVTLKAAFETVPEFAPYIQEAIRQPHPKQLPRRSPRVDKQLPIIAITPANFSLFDDSGSGTDKVDTHLASEALTSPLPSSNQGGDASFEWIE